jgi:hypothetical protein
VHHGSCNGWIESAGRTADKVAPVRADSRRFAPEKNRIDP